MMPLVLADHPLISAVPFLVPAAVILGFLAFYVIRDRRNGGEDADLHHEDDWIVGGYDDDGPEGTDRDHAPNANGDGARVVEPRDG